METNEEKTEINNLVNNLTNKDFNDQELQEPFVPKSMARVASNLTAQSSVISLELLPGKEFNKNSYYYNLFYSSVSGSIFCLLMLSFGCGMYNNNS